VWVEPEYFQNVFAATAILLWCRFFPQVMPGNSFGSSTEAMLARDVCPTAIAAAPKK